MAQFENYHYGDARQKYFQDYSAIGAGIQDDHLPFLNKSKLMH